MDSRQSRQSNATPLSQRDLQSANSVVSDLFNGDSVNEYDQLLEEYVKSITVDGPPGVPPPPIHPELSAETLKAGKQLLRPLPNLFRSTFEQAQRQSPGEAWLQKRIAAFDDGGRRKRKQVLEEFLEYMRQSTTSSMEELFSNQAHLFLVRLTSWFSVTLPLLYELPLQLKVFLAFLGFREQSVVRAFFESGAVVSLMNSLSTDFDVPDDVRCLAVLVLHRLAQHGRTHKEVLCSKGLVSSITECILDGLKWETLKCSGRLLCELFRSNPRYQDEVVDALHELMAPHRRPLAQRVAIQAVLTLLNSECTSRKDWHLELVPRALVLLESQDLRASADAYCLLSRLLRSFSCDALLFEFARAELRCQNRDLEAWLRVETDAAQHAEAVAAGAGSVDGDGLRRRLENRLQAQVAGDIVAAAQRNAGDSEKIEGALNQPLSKSAGEDFRADAGHVLKLGLVVFVAKRNPDLCDELVDAGLTETLLMNLLDVAHPMMQAAALAELHQVRLLSPKAQQLVEAVLVKKDYLRAMTLEHFMAAGTADDLARARFRLRNLPGRKPEKLPRGRKGPQIPQYGAEEHELQQRLMEQNIKHSLGIQPPTTSAFLTQGPAEEAHEADKDDTSVPRSGDGCYAVKRVPVRAGSRENSAPTGERAQARGYGIDSESLEDDHVQEPPVLTALFSLFADPLDVAADAGSPLLEDLHSIETSVRLCEPVRGPVAPPTVSKRRGPGKKASHRIGLEHSRALTMRPVGFGTEPMPSSKKSIQVLSPSPSVGPAPSIAASDGSGVSLLCVPQAADKSQMRLPLQRPHGVSCECHTCDVSRRSAYMTSVKAHGHDASFAETSIGPELSHEFSQEYPSHELQSISQHDALNYEQSLMTIGSGSLGGPGSLTLVADDMEEHDATSEHAKVRPRVLQKSALATLVEIPRLPMRKQLEEVPFKVAKKKILCVEPAPYHKCVAFSGQPTDGPALEGRSAQMLDPSRQQLFEGIKNVGKFPRQWLKSSGPSRDYDMAKEEELASTPVAPWTAREAVQSQQRQLFHEEGHRAGAATHRGVFSAADVVMARGKPPRSPPRAQNMKDFFPASARSVGY